MKLLPVQSSAVVEKEDFLEAEFNYQTTDVIRMPNGAFKAAPRSTEMTIRTRRRVPRLGVMLVGWGGNNGSTLTAAIAANRLAVSWRTKEGVQQPNYFGSITQASTVCLGNDVDSGEEVYVPMKDMLPMVDPNDIVLDGWDISSLDLAASMERAKVLDYDLQRQLKPHLKCLKPREAIYDPAFIAANQADRADNVMAANGKLERVERIRDDIRRFKASSGVDEVIVLWTANTERFCQVVQGFNDTAENLMKSIKENQAEISPSTLYAVASILEGVSI